MLMSLNNIDDSTGAPALAGGGGSELRHAWADLCEHEGGAGGICALLHPDIVMTDQPKWKDRPAMLYADWADTSAHTIRSLAVLQSERRKVAIIPRLGPKLTLFGRQLDGNCLVGDQGPVSIEHFIERIKELLSSGQEQYLTIDDLETHSSLWQALHELDGRHFAVFHTRPPEAHWWLDFPENPADYWTRQFSSKTRSKLRSKAKKLGAKLVHCRTPEDVPGFLRKVDEVWDQSWKVRRLSKRIKTDAIACAYWQRVAAMGLLRAYTLEVEGKPIAFRRGVQRDGTLYFDQSAYVEALEAHSPGTVLTSEVLSDVIANNPPRLVDFGYGDIHHKKFFCNRYTMSGALVIVPRRALPMTVMCAEQARRRTIQAVKAAMVNLGFIAAAEHFGFDSLALWLMS
jgi:hypothetical protein